MIPSVNEGLNRLDRRPCSLVERILMSAQRWTWVMAAVLAAGLVSPAMAADDAAEGKRRFVAGTKLYEEGKYPEAAKEFEAGYAAAPRPAFLLNIGHSYRNAGELEKAKANYELLLELEPNFAKADEIKGHLAEIDESLKKAAAEAAPAVVEETPAPDPAPTGNGRMSGTAGDGHFEYEKRDVLLLRDEDIPENQKKKNPSVFASPWFWVATTAVVGGAVAAFLLLQKESPGCPGTVCLREN